jgi:hypothetical protein
MSSQQRCYDATNLFHVSCITTGEAMVSYAVEALHERYDDCAVYQIDQPRIAACNHGRCAPAQEEEGDNNYRKWRLGDENNITNG